MATLMSRSSIIASSPPVFAALTTDAIARRGIDQPLSAPYDRTMPHYFTIVKDNFWKISRRPIFGTLSGGAGDLFSIAQPSSVQTVASRAEMRDLQKTANDHDVGEKMDHLISVSEVMVKGDRRCQGEHRKPRRHLPHTKTKDQQQPTANFAGNRNCPAQRGQGQAH